MHGKTKRDTTIQCETIDDNTRHIKTICVQDNTKQYNTFDTRGDKPKQHNIRRYEKRQDQTIYDKTRQSNPIQYNLISGGIR